MLKWSLIGFWIYRHIKIVINHWSFMSEAILTIYLKSTFEIFHQRMIIVIIIVISGSFTDVSFFFSLDAGLVCHDQFFHLLYLSFNIKPFIFYFYWDFLIPCWYQHDIPQQLQVQPALNCILRSNCLIWGLLSLITEVGKKKSWRIYKGVRHQVQQDEKWFRGAWLYWAHS